MINVIAFFVSFHLIILSNILKKKGNASYCRAYNYSDDQKNVCNCFFCIISFDNTFKCFKEKR